MGAVSQICLPENSEAWVFKGSLVGGVWGAETIDWLDVKS